MRIGGIALLLLGGIVGLYFVWAAHSWKYQFERAESLIEEQRWQEAEPYLLRALDLARTGPDSEDQACRTLFALSNLYFSMERFPESVSFSNRGVRLARSNGMDPSPAFARALSIHGRTLLMTTKPGDARGPLDRAKEILSKDPAATREDFAWLRNTRGWLEIVAGDPRAADAEFDQAIRDAEVAWPAQHVELPQFVLARAATRAILGDYSGARELQAKARSFWESQPSRDPQTAIALLIQESSLSCDLGNYRSAEASLAKAFALLKTTRSASRRDMIWARSIEGNIAWSRGEMAEAERLWGEVVSFDTEVFGRKHPSTANSVTALSLILLQVGRLKEAEAGARESMETVGAALGFDHTDVASAKQVLAESLFLQGKFDAACAPVDDCIRVRRKLLGAKHPYTGSALALAARIHAKLNRPNDASDEGREAIAIVEAALGSSHPFMGEALLAAAEADLAGGRVEQAIAGLRKSLAVREEIHGPSHPGVAESLTGLAGALRAAGRPEEAVAMESRAKAIRSKWERDER